MEELSKWPLLLVVGESVTEAQANEILLRTNYWWGHTNDKAWQTTICELAGIPQNEYGQTRPEEFEEEIRCLRLHYLHNARIASSWVGGPHGWCDWDGSIGCSSYNIGKWPTIEEITQDWATIAEAFPFLNLTAQVVPDEGEADGPAAEWRVHDGTVQTAEPDVLLTRPTEPGFTVFLRGGERGVSAQRLEAALAQIRAA